MIGLNLEPVEESAASENEGTLWEMSDGRNATAANALRAAGDAKYTMWTSIGSMVLIRVGLSYLFILGPMDMGIYGVWNAMYVDWIVRIAFFLPRYLKGKWKTMSAV